MYSVYCLCECIVWTGTCVQCVQSLRWEWLNEVNTEGASKLKKSNYVRHPQELPQLLSCIFYFSLQFCMRAIKTCNFFLHSCHCLLPWNLQPQSLSPAVDHFQPAVCLSSCLLVLSHFTDFHVCAVEITSLRSLWLGDKSWQTLIHSALHSHSDSGSVWMNGPCCWRVWMNCSILNDGVLPLPISSSESPGSPSSIQMKTAILLWQICTVWIHCCGAVFDEYAISAIRVWWF